jgi:hypothetical protein
MAFFRRLPMAGSPLLFGLASEMEGKVQLSPDVLCEFGGFFIRGLVLSPVDSATRFHHEAIVRLKSLSGLKFRKKT